MQLGSAGGYQALDEVVEVAEDEEVEVLVVVVAPLSKKYILKQAWK